MTVLDPFEYHGYVPLGQVDDQYYGNCVLCGDTKHCYVHGLTGQWDCKKCGEGGNTKTFLQKYVEHLHEGTTGADYRRLVRDRGGTIRLFKRWGVAYEGSKWLIPVYNERGYCDDIRCWSPGGSPLSTKGCKLGLFGLQKFSVRSKRTVCLCEGEWDAMFFYELARRAGKLNDVCVLAVPGAGTFKTKWAQLLAKRRVWVLYDNDEAGDRGALRVYKSLHSMAKELKFVHWPQSRPEGWDVRDHCRAAFDESNSRKAWNTLTGLLHDEPRNLPVSTQVVSATGMLEVPDFTVLPPKDRPSFSRVVATFRKYLQWDPEMHNGLILTLAVCVSQQLPGPPTWLWLGGAAASGKTALLTSTQKSDRVVFRSTLHPKSLVSGFNSGGSDPSLLAEMNGRTLVLKDATEILAQHDLAVQETMAVLRGAFDGHVSRNYGNAVHREYVGLRFTILAGVTHALDAYSTASLGERFLRYRIKVPPKVIADRIRAAIRLTSHENEMEQDTQDVVQRFLAFNVGELPRMPTWVEDRIVPLSQLVGILRATVQRNRGTDEITYKPEPEHGTRVAKQLAKLAYSIAIVKGEEVVSTETYQLLERVALDTANPFHVDIVRAAYAMEGEATSRELEAETGIPLSTLRRRIDDLSVLKVLKIKSLTIDEALHYYSRVKRDPRGRGPATLAKITPPLSRLIQESKLWRNGVQ